MTEKLKKLSKSQETIEAFIVIAEFLKKSLAFLLLKEKEEQQWLLHTSSLNDT